MKRSVTLLLVALLPLAGCKKAQTEATLPNAPTTKPVVYVTNYPLYYFASRIGGTKFALHFPGRALPDPADWNPPADTVVAMQQADLILLNGAGFEPWLMNVSLPDSLLADTSAGYTDRLLPGGVTFTHSHGEAAEHAHASTAPMTWLDLTLAQEQSLAVKNALIRIQPIGKETFEANYEALASDLKELEQAFRKLAEAGARELLMAYSHPLYAYLQHAYGLQGPSLHWEPDAPLNGDMLHEIAHLKEDSGIQYLVWERPPLEASVQQLEEKGIGPVVVEVMSGFPESGDFLDGMRRNLSTLKQLLGQQP